MQFFTVFAIAAVVLVGVARGNEGGWGHDSSEDDDGDRGKRECRCRSGREDRCRDADGAVGCPGTNMFLQCASTACSVQTCPTGQVWNMTLKTCAACGDGMHLAASNQECVCTRGSTFSCSSRSCVPCPKDALVTDDNCTCPITTALDRINNACKQCSAPAVLQDRKCKCNAPMVFSAADWICKPCPGVWQKVGRGPQRCTCSGTQVFDKVSATCADCPSGTTLDRDGDECKCLIRDQKLDRLTKKCQCETGKQLNAAGDACERSSTAGGTVP